MDSFRADLAEDAKEAIDALQKALDMALAKKVPKAVVEEIEAAMRSVKGSFPWVAKSFDEHMEVTVEKAKAEIHGYANHVIQQAGITALTSETSPIALSAPKDSTNA